VHCGVSAVLTTSLECDASGYGFEVEANDELVTLIFIEVAAGDGWPTLIEGVLEQGRKFVATVVGDPAALDPTLREGLTNGVDGCQVTEWFLSLIHISEPTRPY